MRSNIGLTCVVMMLAAGCASARDNDMPKEARTAFEKATEVELYSLDPGPESKDAGNFHGWKVLGKTAVKGDDLKKLWAAIDKGRQDSDGTAAACFNPRHGLRVVSGEETFDLVICYECLSASVYAGDKRAGGFLTTRSPEPVLKKLLTDAKVPLPKN